MHEPNTLCALFENWLTESMRVAIIRELGIEDDRPSILRKDGEGDLEEGVSWVEQYRTSIAPLVLRHVDPPDSLIAGLVAEGDLQLPHGLYGPQIILISGFAKPKASMTSRAFYLSHVLASSALLYQSCVDIAAANEACGIRLPEPVIDLRTGSIQITVGGGLFASGMGLLLACGAGMVVAPVVGIVVGASLATAGIVELALNWRKVVAEECKLYSEAAKIDADRRLTEIDIQIKKLELEKALQKREGTPQYPRKATLPESAEVPRDTVVRTASKLKMSEAYANHILNRTLRNFRFIRQKMVGIGMKMGRITRKIKWPHSESTKKKRGKTP